MSGLLGGYGLKNYDTIIGQSKPVKNRTEKKYDLANTPASQFMQSGMLGKPLPANVPANAKEKVEEIFQRQHQITGAQLYGATTTGDYGDVASGAVDFLMQSGWFRGEGEDKAGRDVSGHAAGQGVLKGLFSAAAGSIGNFYGGTLAGADRASQANSAMGFAGAMANAANERARDEIIKGGNEAYDQLNASNEARALSLENAAIGQADAYERGKQSIGMSGISGSKNMERNLDYGQSLHEAQQAQQFDIMNDEAQRVNDRMVSSFSDLSANKGNAMLGAYQQNMGSAIDAVSDTRRRVSEYVMRTQPTMADFQEAQLLMGGGEAPPTQAAPPAYTDKGGGGLPSGGTGWIGSYSQPPTGGQNQADSEYARADGAAARAADYQSSFTPPPPVPASPGSYTNPPYGGNGDGSVKGTPPKPLTKEQLAELARKYQEIN